MRSNEALFAPPAAINSVIETREKYSARDGAELALFVFRSALTTSTAAKPLVILYHGGGGCLGNPYSIAPLARSLVTLHDVVVVSPQYRLAPEYPFPTGPNDAWDAYAYVAANASNFSADTASGFVVGGISNGAALGSCIALRAKHEPSLPKITGLYFTAPAFIASPDTVPDEYKAAYISAFDQRCINAPVLDAETVTLFDSVYGARKADPLYRAFNTQPFSEHTGIAPKAYFQVCGMDVFRDDGLIYEDILNGLGVLTKIDVYKGTPHVFWGIFPHTSQAKTWREDAGKGFGWLLTQAA